MTLVSELQDICSESCGHDSCACVICRAAYELEQLSAPVLPEEVADVVRELTDSDERLNGTDEHAARLLQRLAGELADCRKSIAYEWGRIRVLEGERDRMRAELEAIKASVDDCPWSLCPVRGGAKLDAKEG